MKEGIIKIKKIHCVKQYTLMNICTVGQDN